MKAKLLKKVRKQYTITRYDELASNDDYGRKIVKEIGLPFYLIEKANDKNYIYTEYAKEYKDAISILWRKIFSSYGEQFRHSDGKNTKVWWSNNKI